MFRRSGSSPDSGFYHIYKMNVLPLVPQKFIDEIEALIKNYIWKNRNAKIPLDLMQCKKQDGGLRLFNFKTKEKSLKAQWVASYY